MILIHFNTDNNDYVLSINNYDSNKNIDCDFWSKLQDTMKVILKRAESYEHNIKAINHDILTDLFNRNAYETRIQQMGDNEDHLVYGLFDLFRLKYINDNYSHAVGDLYIKETAKILKKYWPKQTKLIVENESKLVDTGHSVYRIGGDEFALLTTTEKLELAKIKASLAAEEVSMIDLGIDEKPIIGLNVGLVDHAVGNTIKQTYQEADYLMNEDKKLMYIKHGLERRR